MNKTQHINTNQNVMFTITRNNKPFTVTGDYESIKPLYDSLDMPVVRKQAVRATQSLSKALNVPKLALGGLKQEIKLQAKITVFDMFHNTHYLHDYKQAKRAEKLKAFEQSLGLSYSK